MDYLMTDFETKVFELLENYIKGDLSLNEFKAQIAELLNKEMEKANDV